MELLILGWYILTVTGSVLLLTVYGSLQYVGTLIAPMFGLAGDRLGHRHDPFLVALANDPQQAAGLVDGGDGESGGLADA